MRSLSEKNIKVLPVLYKNCLIPPIIADLKYADFTSNYSSGFAELAIGLDLVNPIPAYSSRPDSIIKAFKNFSKEEIIKIFPYSFSDYPELLFKDGKIDVAIIVGSTDREHTGETNIFKRSSTDVELFGSKWSFSRQVSPGTVRDSVRVADLSTFLGFRYGKYSTGNVMSWSNDNDILCFMDVSVSSDILNRNIILVGGADTNIYIPIATIAFRQKFGFSLPIRYFGDDQLYFTCDQILSEMSNKTYSRLEDSSFMHCGYLLMVANPWSPEKVIIFVVGTRATGTQSALLALMRLRDYVPDEQLNSEPWHNLSYNNRYYPDIPGKIVRARKAKIIDSNKYLYGAREISIPDKTRISQRHIITDFEFLE